MIPYGRQEITDADIAAVIEVLRSDFLTQGPAVQHFERLVAGQVKAAHAVAVSNGTAALHIACAALDLGPSDHLWTVPNTFVASANCGLYCGAQVDFVDIDAHTWNLSVPKLEEKLAQAAKVGTLPKVIVPVHFGGQPTDQEDVWALAQKYGFKVLEDASHAIGASRNGEPAGSCRWSDITVFSFHPVKIVTTGEGGIALTNQQDLADRMLLLRSHGITRDPARMRFADQVTDTKSGSASGPPAWYYEQQLLGFNYRMTDIHAALGGSQLTRLHDYVERRNVLACRYGEGLQDLPLQLPTVKPGNRSSFHLYTVRLLASYDTKSHREVFDELRNLGIGVNLHYSPVHLNPYFRDLGFAAGQFPEAEAHGRSAISLPLYPALREEQQDSVVTALRQVLHG